MGVAVTLLALVVRLVWVKVVPTRPVGDFAMYIESARYFVEHGALDPEFIYMPGYVLAVAAVDALGGGLFAIKMLGVAAGVVTTGAVYGTTRVLFGRPAAIAAGLGAALWPAGVAVSSVTGTDMPAAALLALAVWLLVRGADRRPLGAPVLFGLVLGLAAWVRAIALPLAALAVLHFRARGARWIHAVTRTLAACLVAFLVLVPWGIRNVRRYGEFFLTDSHGGHTALVGANPDTDGVYSRSLNRMFAEGTGYRLFAEPHRDADRAAYRLAKKWTAFEPKFALGLLAAKADRLLSNERGLLYWPLYRASVLPDGSATKAWFDRHHAGIEWLVDGFWWAFVAAALIGVVAAVARRNGAALSILPLPLALAVLYTVFFAEVRYHLAIAALLFPFAGAGVVWVGEAANDFARRAVDRQRRPHLIAEGVAAALAVAVVFLGWPRLIAAGARLRETHRWAVHVCDVDKAHRLCSWRTVQPPPGSAPSPLRGVWDGMGLRPTASPTIVETAIELPPGRYRITMRAEATGAVAAKANAEIALGAGGTEIARAPWPTGGTATPLVGAVTHAGGNLQISIRLVGDFLPDGFPLPALWISDIAVETDGA